MIVLHNGKKAYDFLILYELFCRFCGEIMLGSANNSDISEKNFYDCNFTLDKKIFIC